MRADASTDLGVIYESGSSGLGGRKLSRIEEGNRALAQALSRVLGWTCPPNWSRADWQEEVRAIGQLALVQAAREYEPSWGVPFSAFATRRVVSRVYTRYRQEWSFCTRQELECTVLDRALPGSAPGWAREGKGGIGVLLDGLSESDQALLFQLFYEGKIETQLARDLGISQQAVSKRKRFALRRARVLFNQDSNS